ncbi:hypothetical protein NEOLI_004313 [Neolecta irregularis DAH-3]|uniref:Apple domain-containing protein n=1 Tax=Neolecta irregularis (strain DAH-3) TaxID=1198029 RepID=A0A1U7LMI8_NEOID|nr:hypothetical protein NEOLI_004313 [Neolecta irregularis DAH-3]|eukprot:OLL23875.1 hypothetical protein NEOLI_004313 [Neolecta irregularis DAH-3]
MLPNLYLVLSCLTAIVRAADRYHRIGLTEQDFHNVGARRSGYFYFPQADLSLEEAAADCLLQCASSDPCRATVTFDCQPRYFSSVDGDAHFDSQPCCFMSDQRFWEFKQDDIALDILEKDRVRSTLAYDDDEEYNCAAPLPFSGFHKYYNHVDLEETHLIKISTSIADGIYYAYNIVLPLFPQNYNLELSNGRNIIRDISRFESLEKWKVEFHSLKPRNALMLLRDEIISTFLTPRKHAVESLMNNNISKSRAVMMIQRILNKRPLGNLMLPAVKQYLKFRWSTPNGSNLVNGLLFAEIFLHTSLVMPDDTLDIEIFDDVRLYLAYDLMQYFGLTANDID